MQAETFKHATHALIDTLPDDASWRELAYVAAVCASIIPASPRISLL